MLLRYYLIINILTFLVWGFDKLRAVQHGWRISERALILLIFAGWRFWCAGRDAAVSPQNPETDV